MLTEPKKTQMEQKLAKHCCVRLKEPVVTFTRCTCSITLKKSLSLIKLHEFICSRGATSFIFFFFFYKIKAFISS